MQARVWVWVGALALTAGCGSKDDNTAAHQACRDAAAAIAGSAERCGYDYKVNYDGFVATAANGDCDNVVEVRDARDFYDVCIPWLQSLTCEQIDNLAHGGSVVFPPECDSQLLHP
jgi:hypothetical protein